MKTILKFVLFLILGLLALVLAAVLTLPLWLGPVVKPSVNAAVPKLIGTDFNLGHIALNPYTGRFELGALRVANPKGYSEPDALTLSNLVVDVDMGTLGNEYVHVEEVLLNGVFVSYVTGGENKVDNFTQIQYNVAGGKEAYERKQAEAKAKKEAQAKKDEAKTPEPKKVEKASDGSSKKVVIDHLVLSDIKLKYGMLTLPVPKIELHDLGKKSEGVTLAELGDQIWQAILKSAMAAGDGAKALGALLGDGAKAIKMDKAADAMSAGANKTMKAIGTGTGAAADAVGTSAKAIGDGAKKATDALKGLFN